MWCVEYMCLFALYYIYVVLFLVYLQMYYYSQCLWLYSVSTWCIILGCCCIILYSFCFFVFSLFSVEYVFVSLYSCTDVAKLSSPDDSCSIVLYLRMSHSIVMGSNFSPRFLLANVCPIVCAPLLYISSLPSYRKHAHMICMVPCKQLLRRTSKYWAM